MQWFPVLFVQSWVNIVTRWVFCIFQCNATKGKVWESCALDWRQRNLGNDGRFRVWRFHVLLSPKCWVCVTECHSVSQCVTVCHSVSQCITVCHSVVWRRFHVFLSTISQIGGDIFSKSRILLPGSLNSFKEKNSDIYKLPMTYQCYICANGTMTHKYFGDGGKSSRSTSTVPHNGATVHWWWWLQVWYYNVLHRWWWWWCYTVTVVVLY